MKTQNILRGAALLTVSLLAACGGGSSGGSSSGGGTVPPISSNTCTNGGTNFPVCAVPGTSQQEVAPTYAIGSNEYEAFTELNRIRKSIGLGVVNQNRFIDIAAQNHANYIQRSFRTGDNFHIEVAGREGFTGQNPFDRMKVAGYATISAGTEASAAQVGKIAISVLMNAILHRQTLIRESLSEVGMISTNLNGTIINLGYSGTSMQSVRGDFIGTLPVDGETDVTLTHMTESPNPFEGELEMTVQNMCTKTSAPISVISQAGSKLSVTSFTIREFGSTKDLDVRLLKNGIDNNHAVIVGKEPFKQYQRYEVKFVGKVSGAKTSVDFDVNKTWSFTTGRSLLTCS
jgi:uncharacterized protein YkwD